MNILCRFTAGLLGLVIAASVSGQAAPLSSKDFTQTPPVLSSRETPLVMLGLSVDNQLFYKAYTDYADIDSDGRLDTGYADTFDYYGYFNSDWCYSYSSGDSRFVPESAAAGTNGHSCNASAGRWSGNFLNWATMTRIDILRRVLYGGKRSADTTALTVLERAYIPSDVHAFAKVYKESNIAEFTPYAPGDLKNGALTLCNVSSAHGTNAASSTPQLRLAKGDYRRWSINESQQCQWGSGANRPATADQLNNGSEYAVRVEACKSGKDDSADVCKLYSSGSSKPVGLLQQYGENGDLKFGLISGSYDNYISGGMLRKNIGLFGSNDDPGDDEINLTSGQFRDIDGIIKSIDALRIIGWSGSSYSCGGAGISISNFKNETSACRDWGNPVSEIYAEAVRYFAGATAETSAYAGDDTGYIAALKKATWPATLAVNPLNTNSRCAACSIIMISSGVGSFDGDEFGSISDVAGLSNTNDLKGKTDSVGALEYGGFPKNALIGSNGTGSPDLLCSSKSLSGLGSALGLCPEAPALEGTYQIAGLAYHAKTTDLRTDTGMDGDQTVDTYGVELSESVPSFNVPVGSGEIRFLPACQSRSGNSGNWIPCSLFDVEVLDVEYDSTSGNVVAGTLMFHWEDSSWGSDYDLDASQVISFCVGGSSSRCANANNDTRTNATYDDSAVGAGRLRISQGVAYTAAGFNIRLGYVVTGSNDDGAPGSATRPWLVRPGNENRNDLCQLESTDLAGKPLLPVPVDAQSNSCSSGQTDRAYYPIASTFSASSSSALLLERPLFLAAKYGGFNDRDGDGTPAYTGPASPNSLEWDLTNNRTGASSADGVPDNYFFASNPSLLLSQLQRVFESLVARTASGTNAAVVANSSSGVGAVYQALYQPQYTVGSNTVTWTGTLRAIFIDQAGYLREDANSNAKLDNYATDPIVRLEFDASLDKTFVQRYSLDVSGNLVISGQPVELNELKPVWSAVDRLAALTLPEQQKTSYQAVDTDRRYILTALDRNTDGEVDSQDVVAFTAAGMSSAYADYFEYLGLGDTAEAQTLIDYLRGKEVAGLRPRVVDYDNDGTNEVWRLGDIIHSTPAVVASPKDSYDTLYSDTTYRTFVNQYVNRRQMIYVGANDGMIHAFNGGFWDAANQEFKTTPLTGSAANQPLGQEMWAYAPQNLLPHLRWLAEPDYQHVYYMDGEPIVFDANVFPTDATHPEGWGTILVMGMRLGGSPIDVSIGGTSETMRSAYVIFDVTDPEQPPVLLGEIAVPELGFTLSKPAVIKNRQPNAISGDWSTPAVNDWYLVFGSGPIGPDGLSQSQSNQSARLFALDLEQLVTNSSSGTLSAASPLATISGGTNLNTGIANSFIGGMTVADWDRNYSDDALYFGTVEGSVASPGGRLMRLLINDNEGASKASYGLNGAISGTLLNIGQPIQSEPLAVRDTLGERWLLSGTGKLLVPNDNDLASQQWFVGVKEPRNSTTGDLSYGEVTFGSLVDTSDVAVFETSGEVRDISGGTAATLSIGGNAVTDFNGLETTLTNFPGWKKKMQFTSGAPAGRVTSKATQNPSNRRSFAFTEYVPPAQSCEIDGESFLYALAVTTGTATPDAPLNTSTEYVVNEREMSLSVLSLGAGQASGVTYHQGSEGTLNAITNMSTGAIQTTTQGIPVPESGRQSWRQIDTTSF